jgi:predicted porin
MQEALLKAVGAANEGKGSGLRHVVTRRLTRWRLTARYGFAYLMLAAFYSQRKDMKAISATPASASA